MTRIFLIIPRVVLPIIILIFVLQGLTPEPAIEQRTSGEARITPIPDNAEIVFHEKGPIYTMDKNGGSVTQITFATRKYGHVAVSYDRRFIIANEQLPNPENEPGGRSILWLYDIINGTENRLLSGFDTAGNGGWTGTARDSYILPAGKRKWSLTRKPVMISLPTQQPMTCTVSGMTAQVF